jgi:hypothetical protein
LLQPVFLLIYHRCISLVVESVRRGHFQTARKEIVSRIVTGRDRELAQLVEDTANTIDSLDETLLALIGALSKMLWAKIDRDNLVEDGEGGGESMDVAKEITRLEMEEILEA